MLLFWDLILGKNKGFSLFISLKIFLPKYLYDENYINDVNYLFNFQIVNDYSYDMIESNIQNDIPDYAGGAIVIC